MFIKLIQIHPNYDTRTNLSRWYLREIVLNKKYIISMVDTEYFQNVEKDLMPNGLSGSQSYTHVSLEDEKIFVVGGLDHIYKLLETDSALNYRQTLKG